MFKWFWTIFSLGAPGMCPGINTPNSVFWLVRDKRFLLEDTSKMTKFFLSFYLFFSREIVTRWDGYFYWRRLSPFRFSRTYCKICKITCFSLRHSLPANPPRGGNLVPDDPRHKKMVSMTTNSKLNICLREVCSRRQSSCRTNKNMKNNM